MSTKEGISLKATKSILVSDMISIGLKHHFSEDQAMRLPVLVGAQSFEASDVLKSAGEHQVLLTPPFSALHGPYEMICT